MVVPPTIPTDPLYPNKWDFGNGNKDSTSGATVNYTYPAAGNFNVILTVMDDFGQTDTAMKLITVSVPNVAPVANIVATPTVGEYPLLVNFDATGSTDNDGTIVSYEWDFGDGNTDNSGASPSHTYVSDGVYTTQLIITDEDGASDTATVAITVNIPNIPPVASFTASPDSGKSPWQLVLMQVPLLTAMARSQDMLGISGMEIQEVG